MKLSELIEEIKSNTPEGAAPTNMAVSFYNRRFAGPPDVIEDAAKRFNNSYGIDIMDLEVTAQSSGAAYGQDPKAVVVFIDSAQVDPESLAETNKDDVSADAGAVPDSPPAAEVEDTVKV